APRDVDPELRQRVVEFLAAAAHETGRRRHLDRRLRRDRRARATLRPPREDQRPRLLARLREPAFHEREVEALLRRARHARCGAQAGVAGAGSAYSAKRAATPASSAYPGWM